MLAAAIVAVTCAATAATAFAAAPADFDDGAFETKAFPVASNTRAAGNPNLYIKHRFFNVSLFTITDWGQSDIGFGGNPNVYMSTQTCIHERDGGKTWSNWVIAQCGSTENEAMLYDGYLTGQKVRSRLDKSRRIQGFFHYGYDYYGPWNFGNVKMHDFSVYR